MHRLGIKHSFEPVRVAVDWLASLGVGTRAADNPKAMMLGFEQVTWALQLDRHWGCSHHHRVNFHRSVARSRKRQRRPEGGSDAQTQPGGRKARVKMRRGTTQTAVELKICGWRPRRRGVWQRQGTEGTARAMGGTAAAITIQELRWLDSKTAVSPRSSIDDG
ncbi:arginine/ornithine succinyltransferase subunit alpha [Sesbania bispinosa]|nr:arginine/ornithine succinyltransferase subunit alpha [Sesbania bispinosa]